MKSRHLSEAEKNFLRDLVEDAGLPEVLRVVGQLAAHNAADLHEGIAVRSALAKVANDAAEMKWVG